MERTGKTPGEQRKLLDNLVQCGQVLEKLSSEDERMRMEVKFLAHRVKSAYCEEQIVRENRRLNILRRVEVLAYRKKLTEQLSRTREQISQTKMRLG